MVGFGVRIFVITFWPCVQWIGFTKTENLGDNGRLHSKMFGCFPPTKNKDYKTDICENPRFGSFCVCVCAFLLTKTIFKIIHLKKLTSIIIDPFLKKKQTDSWNLWLGNGGKLVIQHDLNYLKNINWQFIALKNLSPSSTFWDSCFKRNFGKCYVIGLWPPTLYHKLEMGKKNTTFQYTGWLKGNFHELDHKYPNTSHNQM